MLRANTLERTPKINFILLFFQPVMLNLQTINAFIIFKAYVNDFTSYSGMKKDS